VGCGSDGPCDPEAPNTICTVAGSGEQGFNGDRGPATEAALYVPQDVAISPEGDVWLLDFNNYVIRKVKPDGTIQVVVGNGELGDSPEPGQLESPAIEALFNHTTDLFFHQGYLYLAAWHASWIKRVRLSDMMIENFAGRGRRTFYDGDGGPALEASLDLPSSIALSPSGDIVIMDQASQVVRAVDPNGVINRIAGKCVVDLDDPCMPGEQPIACPDSNKFTCGNPALECSKPCTPGFSGDGGPALEARLGQPYGQSADPAGRVAYDSLGRLVIADTENNRIRRVDENGIIDTIAGIGERGYTGEGGPALAAKINRPIDIAIDEQDNIFFTDVENSCIRKITPDGLIKRVAGKCNPDPTKRGFSGDGGDPLDAKLDRPYGIELHGKKLYISDSYNNRIRVVNLP
jgi:hypothetical protein